MKVGVIGTGYVGLVTGVMLADFGLPVLCMDRNEEKIKILKSGKVPFYEPGLEELVERNLYYKRIDFTSNIRELTEQSDVIFIAVGTPSLPDGSADLSQVQSAVEAIGANMAVEKTIVNKSTVPMGTGKKIREWINGEIRKNGKDIRFDLVSNPEFLRQGKAVYDFTHPDRVVIGTDSDSGRSIMQEVYRVLRLNKVPFIFTNIETAEMIKYASNAFLGVKISFINELALLAEKVNANIQDIALGMGMDGRISPYFLHAGPGFGGSCFPKDMKAIVDMADKSGVHAGVIRSALDANERQKKKMVDKIREKIGDLKDRTIGLLGLTFKPDTDDTRDAPSLDIVRGLAEMGAKLRLFCPKGMKEARKKLDGLESIVFCDNEYEAAEGSVALVIVTEWHQFRGMDLPKIRSLMNGDYFFDFRNIYSSDSSIRSLFNYTGVGVN